MIGIMMSSVPDGKFWFSCLILIVFGPIIGPQNIKIRAFFGLNFSFFGLFSDLRRKFGQKCQN